MNEKNIRSLIVDWGTTNFRAFAMDDQGRIIDEQAHPLGLLQVKDGAFAASLQAVLGRWLSHYQDLPVYMAGMVGSMKGWVNVEYAKTQAGAAELAGGAYRFVLPWGSEAFIIPGVCHQRAPGVQDVMRGEEVQLLGLSQLQNEHDFHAMLPGTHNKHVHFSEGKISAFSSYLTGELFSVVSEHMLIGKGLDKSQLGAHDEAFLKGVDEGSETEQLTSTLFQAWTHRLFKHLREEEVLDYLSGLLIGNELKALKADHYYLVGGSALCKRYQQACMHINIHTQIVSGNACFISGMNRLIKELKHD